MDEHQDKLDHLHGGEVPLPPKIPGKRLRLTSMLTFKHSYKPSLLDGWATGCKEVVEIHHHVYSRVQEGTKATLASSNKPEIFQLKDMNLNNNDPHLGPHQHRRGRVP